MGTHTCKFSFQRCLWVFAQHSATLPRRSRPRRRSPDPVSSSCGRCPRREGDSLNITNPFGDTFTETYMVSQAQRAAQAAATQQQRQLAAQQQAAALAHANMQGVVGVGVSAEERHYFTKSMYVVDLAFLFKRFFLSLSFASSSSFLT